MKITPDSLTEVLTVVRPVKPSESAALLGPSQPRLEATAARIQSVLLQSGLVAQPLSLDPIFRWPPGVDPSACRG